MGRKPKSGQGEAGKPRRKRKYWILLAGLMLTGTGALALPFADRLPFFDKEGKKQAYLERGRQLHGKGAYKEAVIELKNALQIDRGLAPAHHYLGLSQLELGEFQEAFRSLSLATQADPELTDAQIRLGELLLLGRNYEQANVRANKALEFDPESVAGNLLKARLALAHDDPDSAHFFVDRALRTDPSSVDARTLQSALHVQDGEHEQAKSILRSTIAEQPGELSPRVALSNLLLAENRHDEAADVLRRAVEDFPGDARAEHYLGLLHLAPGEVDSSALHFGAALDHDSGYRPSRSHLALVRLSQADTSSADSLIQAILADRPDDLDGLYLQGRLQLMRGRAKGALDALKSVATRAPEYRFGSNSYDLGYFLALAYYETGSLVEARDEVKRLLDRYPGAPRVQMLYASLSLKAGDTEAAAAARAVLKADPDNVQAALIAGQASLQSGDVKGAEPVLERAIAGFQEALAENPRNLDAALMLGQTLTQVGRLGEAERVLVSAADQHPSIPTARLALGSFYQAAGNADRATSLFRSAVASTPDDSPSHLALGEHFAATGQRDSAEAHLERALALDPGVIDAKKQMAMLFLTNQEVDRADSLVQAILTERPEDQDAAYLSGRIDLVRGNHDAAFRKLQRVAGRNRDYRFMRRAGDLDYFLGLALYQSGRYREANEQLDVVLERYPDSPQARLLAADLAQRRGDSDESMRHLNVLLTQDPSNLAAALLLGPVLVRTGVEAFEGDLSAVRKMVESKAKETDSPLEARLSLGAFYQAMLEPALAEGTFREASRAFPSDPRSHLTVGMHLMAQNQPDSSEAALRRGIALGGGAGTARESAAARKYLAFLLLSQGRTEEADALIDEVLSVRRDDVDALYLAGRMDLAADRPADAVAKLTRVKELAPGYRFAADPQGLDQYLGMAQYAAGQVEEAARTFAASPTTATTPTAHLMRAEMAMRSGDAAAAEEAARKVLEADPGNAGGSIILGAALLQTSKAAEAERTIAKLLQREPGHVRARMMLGEIHARQGKQDEALASFERVLEADPGNGVALRRVVSLLARSGRGDEAVDRCDSALRAAPENAEFQEIMGNLLVGKGDFTGAEDFFKRAVALDAKRSSSHFSLGMIFERSNRPQDAIDAYEKAIEISPEFGAAANNLAWLYAEAGNELERAWQLAERARTALPNDPNVVDTLGWVHYKSGSYNRAISLFESCVAKVPKNAIFHYHLGMAYLKSGDSTQARASLQKSLDLDPSHSSAAEAAEVLRSI